MLSERPKKLDDFSFGMEYRWDNPTPPLPNPYHYLSHQERKETFCQHKICFTPL